MIGRLRGVVGLALGVLLAVGLAACDSGEECGVDVLCIDDVVVGNGAEVYPGSTVTIDYVGRFPSSTVFDDGENVTFNLNGVIEGFREGLLGMRVGGERRITIPPDMGYGAAGRPPVIPPNATLIFDVTLHGVE